MFDFNIENRYIKLNHIFKHPSTVKIKLLKSETV